MAPSSPHAIHALPLLHHLSHIILPSTFCPINSVALYLHFVTNDEALRLEVSYNY